VEPEKLKETSGGGRKHYTAEGNILCAVGSSEGGAHALSMWGVNEKN